MLSFAAGALRPAAKALMAASLLGCGPTAPSTAEIFPDVVIVLVDTLRADFTSLTDSPAEFTPFLAELAADSVVFENASSPGPWTLPSVASIVSGQHLAAHGVFDDKRMLPTSMPTLAERLRAAGFATRSAYHNPFAGPMCALDRGYEVSRHIRIQAGGDFVREFIADVPGNQALYLYIHNSEPHGPEELAANLDPALGGEQLAFVEWYTQAVKEYRDLTRRGYQAKNRAAGIDFDAEQQRLLDELSQRQAEADRIYARSVADSDARIATIVAELKERGRWDQTVFVVIADHGEELGEHGGWLHDQSLYQELVHVPFLIRFPGDKFGGTRVEEAASLVDLVPTVLGALGVAADQGDLPGVGWHEHLSAGTLATLDEEPRVVSSRINSRKRFAPWEQLRGDRNIAVRQGMWKGIWNVDRDTFELYDLESDPGELDNLAQKRPRWRHIMKELAQREWAAMEARREHNQGGGFESLDEASHESLIQLGYLGEDDG